MFTNLFEVLLDTGIGLTSILNVNIFFNLNGDLNIGSPY